MRSLPAFGGTAAVALATILAPAAARAATTTQHIVFVRAGNVFITNTDGSGVKQLTTTGEDSQPVVKGTRIVFDREGWIWTMTTTGANQQQWFAGRGGAWDPSGRNRISYITEVDDGGTGSCSVTYEEVNVQDLTAGSSPTVLDDDFDCWAPAGWTTAWVTSADSPAGSVITSQAVTDPDGNNPGYLTILKIPVRQGAPAQSLATIHKQPQGFSPAVAATSKLVTFTTALVNGQKHVYTVSATAASKPTQIGSDRNVRTPSFSPDGKHLIWTQGDTIREYTFATKKTITLINNGGPSPSWG